VQWPSTSVTRHYTYVRKYYKNRNFLFINGIVPTSIKVRNFYKHLVEENQYVWKLNIVLPTCEKIKKFLNPEWQI